VVVVVVWSVCFFLLFFLSSFLPSFLPRYIYVTISGSSIGLPRMSELSKEKQTVYLRRSSLMHNIVCPSTRLSQMERKPSTIRIPTYSTYSTRDDVLSDCPIHLLLLPAELNGKFCSVEKAIHLSSIQFFCSNYLVAFIILNYFKCIAISLKFYTILGTYI